MTDERRLNRWKLRQYLRVFEQDSDILMGHLADITMAGMRLVSGGPLRIDETYHLWMEIMSERVEFEARCVWCRKDEKSDLYNAGFKLVNPSSGTITNIQCLIAALKALRDV